ncbi:MAG TPA: hypothetical protein PKA79_00870 [Oligoflexia bacterium]|nr:hypothetical protein [Oligoflexia bacterium]
MARIEKKFVSYSKVSDEAIQEAIKYFALEVTIIKSIENARS